MAAAMYWYESATGIHAFSPPWIPHFPPSPIPPGCHRAPALGALPHTSHAHWLSILHMVMYMFQCCSPKSSHTVLLPVSSKLCSSRLCLFCCPEHRIVSTIFLGSIYVFNIWYLSFSFWLNFTLYNSL